MIMIILHDPLNHREDKGLLFTSIRFNALFLAFKLTRTFVE